MKIKILITGAAGNIGSSLFNYLINDNRYFIYAVDNLSTGNIKNLDTKKSKNYKFIKIDINDQNKTTKLFKQYKFHYIFHYAAMVGVSRTQDKPLMVLDDINGIKNILNCSIKKKPKRIFFSSSSEVYGEPHESPQNELTTPLNSRLPYAIVKNVCEAFLKSYHTTYKIPYTILRLFNTYGPNQNADFVVTKFIKKAIKNEDIDIYGDGTQTRSFIYIDDNIQFTNLIFDKNIFINDTVNVGNDFEISIHNLAKKIIKITNSSSKINFIKPLKDGDMKSRNPDIRKMKKFFKKKMTTLDVGIKLTIDHFLKND